MQEDSSKSPDTSSGLGEIPSAPKADDDGKLVSTLERGLRILSTFRANDKRPLNNRDIAERSGLHKATVSRLTQTLATLGYVVQDPKLGSFTLGPSTLRLAHVYLAGLDVRGIARPHMQKLADEFDVVVALSLRDKQQIVTIEAVAAESPLHFRVTIGSHVPIAETAIGHAYLTGLSLPRREALIKEIGEAYGPGWPDALKRIRRDLAAVEDHGYCISLGEWHAQLNGVAVPIVVDPDSFVLAMSCGGFARNVRQDELHALGRKMVVCKSAIERAVGAV